MGQPTDSPSIFLLVRSLETGGAERQLTQLALGLKQRNVSVTVGVFYRVGPLAVELQDAHIPIADLGKRGRWDIAGFLFRLARALRVGRPDVVYTFLGGANIAAAIVRPFCPGLRLAWSIRASNMDLSHYDWTHRLAFRLERLLSRSPDVIIANSNAGADFAIRKGFPPELIRVVRNGIDANHFRPEPETRASQRSQWGLSERDLAVGVLARLDPMKDHETFLRAAALVTERRPECRFLCIGEGPLRERLEAFARDLGLLERVRFTGQADPLRALNALDCACSSSITEGFPNAVAEAMACGTACVVTDVGDSANLVGDTGSVVPARDSAALAQAILYELDARGAARSAAARQRIIEKFSVDTMVELTLGLLSRTCAVPNWLSGAGSAACR